MKVGKAQANAEPVGLVTTSAPATGAALAEVVAPLFFESHLVEEDSTSDAWVDEVLEEIKGRRARSLVVDSGRPPYT